MSPDQQTIGRYRILERVGRGGMGVVYRGVDPVLDREVAIKVMTSDFTSDGDDDAKGRFFREARAAAKLQHRNIVTIFEFAEDGGVPYIVMEFLRGQSLAARMAAQPPLSLGEKLDIVAELCTGLHFAHENGVVHRDVKPANVWLLEDGKVKLLDFGIAKIASSTLTRQGDVLGSASYMAPEQILGSSVDRRADLFSAAVLLYELVAGRRPFQGEAPTTILMKIIHEDPEPIEAVVTGLPPELAAAVVKGLQKDPADRYQTGGDFATDLQLIRMSIGSAGDLVTADQPFGDTVYGKPAGTAITSRPTQLARPPRQPTSVAPTGPQAAGRRQVPLVGAAAVAVLVAGLGWFVATRLSTGPEEDPGPAAEVQKPVATPELQSAPKVVLRVVSEPDGAAIEVDGRETGLVTPAEVQIDGQPPQRIRLTKRGFQPLAVPLTPESIAAGIPTLKLIAAEQVTVSVSAGGSYPFEVVDGQRVLSPAATSHTLTVPSGRTVRLRAPAYLLDFPVRVDAAAGRTMTVQAPELGRLTIRSGMETCQVFVNGYDLGFPPITNHLTAAGTYGVQLKCPDGQTVTGSSVTVMAGQQQTIAKVP